MFDIYSGHADSIDGPTPTLEMLLATDVKDPMLKSIKDTLSNQLNRLIQFREQVYTHKKEVKEQEKVMLSRSRKEAKEFSKSLRKQNLSTAVEMNFERRCAHDDRVGMKIAIDKCD